MIAFGQLSLATGNKEYADIAKRTFDIVLSKVDNPKGKWNKAAPGARALKSFALPMILCNVALEIEPLLDPDFMRRTIDTCIHEVMDVFYRPELGLIVEHLGTDGQLVDCFDGRLLNPGHAIEAMWFIMDLGKRLGRQDLIDKAVQIALNEAEYGWDKQYGGIFYFMDRLGRPCQQLEWDQNCGGYTSRHSSPCSRAISSRATPSASNGLSVCTNTCGATLPTPNTPSGLATSTAAARCCSRSRVASGKAVSTCHAASSSAGKYWRTSQAERKQANGVGITSSEHL